VIEEAADLWAFLVKTLDFKASGGEVTGSTSDTSGNCARCPLD